MDALTAKLGKLSKPQIILTAAGAGIAMAIAYRLADRTLDSVLPKKKVEEEEVKPLNVLHFPKFLFLKKVISCNHMSTFSMRPYLVPFRRKNICSKNHLFTTPNNTSRYL